MRKPSPLAVSALSLIALGILNHAYAQDSTLNLPSTTISTTADAQDDAPTPGYQGKPNSTTTRLNLTAQQTPQGVTEVKREQLRLQAQQHP
ncbi:hypothetical protein [Pseudomonas eucalypticola]|uniref:hypothetical protein n=1 Tax=Pseudomonas eucalypticola TaxID=2599595 RepID=UPI001FD805D6|nr:hypothetical protein [Pseudomonas eucalypticola]